MSLNSKIFGEMSVQDYVSQEKKIYESLLRIIECEPDNEYSDLLCQFYNQIELQKIDQNRDELGELLQAISCVSQNYNRSGNLATKIMKILTHYSEQIKQSFSNFEIFNFFKKDKLLLLSLFEHEIISVDENILKILIKRKEEIFFYYEVKNLLSEKEENSIKEAILQRVKSMNEFEEKRKIGENNEYLCELIRTDSIEQFVTFVNQANIPLNSQIEPSIFETNSFLINKKATLIEYAAFFGSIKIFQYLRLNKVELESSLWFYAIHSNKAELIHLLEECHIELPDSFYLKLLKESIKCHHNSIANYFINNYINESDAVFQIKNSINENIVSYCFHYHNYDFIPDYFNDKRVFIYMCKYNYVKLVKLFIENEAININFELILIYLCIYKISNIESLLI